MKKLTKKEEKKSREDLVEAFVRGKCQAFQREVKANLFDAIIKEFKTSNNRNIRDLAIRIEEYLNTLIGTANYFGNKTIESENLVGEEVDYILEGIKVYVTRQVSKFKVSDIHIKKKEPKHNLLQLFVEYENILSKIKQIKAKKYQNTGIELNALKSEFQDIPKGKLNDWLFVSPSELAETIIAHRYGYHQSYKQKLIINARKEMRKEGRKLKRNILYFKKLAEIAKQPA